MKSWLRQYRGYFALSLVCNAVVALAMHYAPVSPPVPADSSRAAQVTKPAEPVKEKLLPLGGRTLFPEYRLVALYGHPDSPALGTLGDQPMAQTLERARQLAAQYQSLSGEKIMPALELITTIAAAEPTDNNDYSREADMAILRSWVQAAREADVYVVLDLQPGFSDFPTQAKQFEGLLREPHVGLALDPEWRLAPGQMHMRDIGSVGAAEVNATSAWLADLTAQHKLPQKLFLLHQFRLDMLPDRAGLDVSRNELAYVVQMDGHGSQAQKQDTWNAMLQGAPPQLRFGWKNFHQYDAPMLTPEETMRMVPAPWFVSYQ